jgi:FkbM family methyltransferase
MLTKNHLTLPFYVPRIFRLWKNWPEYLFNYICRHKTPAEYRMRDGLRLIDKTGGMEGTLAVVFVRREYGEVDRFRTIVDIGANIGTFAIHAALSNPQARVYCYEPEKKNFDCLRNNIEVNRLGDRVFLFQRAVASYNGPRELAVGDSLSNSFVIVPPGATRQPVICTTLRSIIESRNLGVVDLLKMNCEGGEYEILESCSNADFDRILNIRLEYHNMGAPNRNGRALSRFLEDRGYKIERFTRYRKTSGFIWAARDLSTSKAADLAEEMRSRVANADIYATTWVASSLLSQLMH